MKKFSKTLASLLSLTMTLSCMPVVMADATVAPDDFLVEIMKYDQAGEEGGWAGKEPVAYGIGSELSGGQKWKGVPVTPGNGEEGIIVEISDSNAEGANADNTIATKATFKWTGGQPRTTLWGYQGIRYYYPAPNYCYKDISDYADKGYAVFKVDSVAGDADNAFFTIATSPNATAAKDPWGGVGNPAAYMLHGVKVTDYYDIAEGGSQIVAVPLKDFGTTTDFERSYSVWTEFAEDSIDYNVGTHAPMNLEYFGGMGVAKNDGAAGNTLEMSISGMYIVDAPATPELISVVSGADGVDIMYVPVDGYSNDDFGYRLIREASNGEIARIDFDDDGTMMYTDTTADPANDYTYKLVSVIKAYNVESVPSVGDLVEGSGNAGKTRDLYGMKWEAGAVDKALLACAVGQEQSSGGANIWTGAPAANEKGISVKISDSDVTDGSQISTTATTWAGTERSYCWGYQGIRYDDPTNAEFPEVDISANAENAYAIFKVTSVSGDADNAYFVLTTASASDRGPWGNIGEYPFNYIFKGVSVTEYYDLGKGGEQIVAIPLSKFATSEFNLSYSLYGENEGSAINNGFNYQYFNGMGIVKIDGNAGQTLQMGISEMLIAELPQEPTAFEANVVDGAVELSFTESSDRDVEYKIMKSTNGIVEELIPVNGEYTDTNADLSKNLRYTVVAKSVLYGTEAKSETLQLGTYFNIAENEGTYKVVYANKKNAAKIYVAYYDGASLDNVMIYDAPKQADDAPASEITITANAGDHIKVFMWGADNEPFADAASVTVPTV